MSEYYFSGYTAVMESLFITIPSELVSAVFGYLAAKDLVVCSSVCRKWKQYSSYESVWKALCYRNWGWQKEIDWSNELSKPNFSWKNLYRHFVHVYLDRSKYYHGKLTREQAETLLKNKAKGAYLVRDSSHKGHYVISVVSSTAEILHMLVIKIGIYKGYLLETENCIYSTISELIKCHRQRLKPNSAVPKNHLVSTKEFDTNPAVIASAMVEEVTDEKLAPAHAVERGLLHKLCKHGLIKLLTQLLSGPQSKFTSSVNARYKGKTPLHYLAKGASLALRIEPFLEIAQLLHKYGTDFNIKDSKGCTPIHYLITDVNTSYRMVNTFIESGAKIDGTEGVNTEGFNALGLAVSRGSVLVMQLLLNTVKVDDAGAFIGNTITQDTLIHLAAMTEDISVVKAVKSACPTTNVNVVNRYKSTPLHAVVAFDQDWTNLAQFGKPRKTSGYSFEIVEHLLATCQADPNLQDEEGKTPLHYACANGHRTSTVCLLNRGAVASLTIKDNYGLYPENYCRDRLKSPSSAVQWHMQALKERIHAGYKALSVEMLTDRVETHYSEILKEVRKFSTSANGKK